ncbi:MAG: Rrf2 family transcriptional regulator [Phycisphaerae bacterium]
MGKASCYAISSVLYIAQNQDGGPVSATRISDTCGIPRPYLLKVLRRLAHAKVLKSHGGRSGGFTLRKPANRTTLLSLVEAIQGSGHRDASLLGKIVQPAKARKRIVRVFSYATRQTESTLQKATISRLLA